MSFLAAAISHPSIAWLPLLAPLILAGGALLILMVRSVGRERFNPAWMSLTITAASIIGSGWALIIQTRSLDRNAVSQTFGGMVVSDHFATFTSISVLLALSFALCFLPQVARRSELPLAEMTVLLLLAAAGMQIMTSAYDLIVVFLALELFSIALYVLVAIDTRRTASLEGAFKYFVLGAFSSAILLYGIAMVYASAGSTNLGDIAKYFTDHVVLESGTMLLGIVLLIVGFGFKIAAVPFHMWAPDAYEGAPTPITAFMAAAVKVAAFGALIRIIGVAYAANRLDWQPILFGLAAASLVIGSVVGIVQRNVKRMLAYSSITHAGYLLVGVQAATEQGFSAVLFYVLSYSIIVSGTFGILSLLEDPDSPDHSFEQYRGLSARRPWIAALLTLFLIAQAGIPFTAGFTAKLTVFQAGVDANQYGIVIIAVLAAAIAAYMYLRVIMAMYLQDNAEAAATAEVQRVGIAPRIALGLAAVGTVWLGVAPDWVLRWADNSPACVVMNEQCSAPTPADVFSGVESLP